jgi:hypothetical protein
MPQPATGPTPSGDAAADTTGASGAGRGDTPLAADAPSVISAASSTAASAASSNGSASHRSADGAPPAGPAAGRKTSRHTLTGRRPSFAALAALSIGAIRRHWLASALVAAGLALRVLVEMAYHPAIVYIDSLKYLYGRWPGSDPVAYKIPLRMILTVGDLGTVTVIQHLLGLATAVAIYVVMIRRGLPRWLGALAMAPVLLDGYQLQTEQMIMPDVWFEALIVAGLAVLLWDPKPRMRMLLIGTAILGVSTGMRQAGEILIVPALIFAVALGGGWRKILASAAVVTVAFIGAVGLYMSASAELTGHFYISESDNSLTYGRMAAVANCATLQIPSYARPLCPTKAQQAEGADWLDHNVGSPLKIYETNYGLLGSPDGSFISLIKTFNKAVEHQQPTRVLSAIARDSVKLFALTRTTSPGDTPIWRWQFQTHFPVYPPYVEVKNGLIVVSLAQSGLSPVTDQPLGPALEPLKSAYGGAPQVDVPIAAFLRHYQRGGGYTPGPLLALCVLAGLIGSAAVFARRRLTPARSQLVLACLLFFSAAITVLAISDAFEFTWRYQLPALVTLPPAGALGIGVLIAFARKSRRPASADTVSERAPELATPAT